MSVDMIAPALEALRGRGIHSILAQFCDIHGVAGGKLMPPGLMRDMADVGDRFSVLGIWVSVWELENCENAFGRL